MNDSKKLKKIASGIIAGSCVLSSQALVEYGFYERRGGITTRASSSVQVFGASEDEVIPKVRTLSEDVEVLDENNSCDGLRYELNGEEATLTKCTNREITEVEIPKFVSKDGKTYKVTSIGNSAFWNCSNLSSIELPDSLASIGEYAFSGCSSLSSIELPDSLTSIGGCTFYDCSSLSSIELPGILTSLGEYAFSGCSSLKEIIIPKGAPYKSILENMELSSRIVEVDKLDENNSCDGLRYELNGGEATLTKCESNEETIEVPKFVSKDGKTYRVTSLGEYVFWECRSLSSITLPESVTSIGEYVFGRCSSLSSIELPDSLTSIGEYAFWYCSSLSSIELPDSLTSIGEYAFWSCSSLEEILIPKGAPCKSILEGMKLSSKIFEVGELDENNSCDSLRYELNGEEATLTKCKSNEETIKVPKFVSKDGKTYKVTSIGNAAFRNDCRSLSSIKLPDSLTSIGECAFERCSSLSSIKLPDSLTSIGKNAFAWCSNLSSIELPKSVTSIGEYTFWQCSSLSSIELPDSLTSIGCAAFWYCSSLSSITLPGNLTSIERYAFQDCSSLKSITLPESVTSIGKYAFAWCSNLSSIKLPDSLTSIGEYAFERCSSLSSIIIPKGAKCKSILEGMGLGSKIVEVGNSESNAVLSIETTPFVKPEVQKLQKQSGILNNGNMLNIAAQTSQSYTAFDSELMLDEEGSSKSLIANLYEKITAGSVGNSQISEWLKNSTQKVISKLENILQIKENTSNSLVIDVSSVSEDISKNEMTLNLDKSYIDKEIYITCIYDDNNIFYLTGEGKWEKLTEETKEVKGVKMDASSSFKFKDMMKECVFIITTKD